MMQKMPNIPQGTCWIVQMTVLIFLVTVIILISPLALAEDDEFEENDSKAQAAEVEEGTYENLTCSEDDDDWYRVYLNQGDNLTVTIRFDGDEIDLDMLLEDQAGQEMDWSEGEDSTERVMAIDVDYTGYYYVEVYSYYGEGPYSMEVVFAIMYPEGIVNVEQAVFNNDDDSMQNDASFFAHVKDEFVAGSAITIYDRDSGDEVDSGHTNSDGEWVSPDMSNGDYRWEAVVDGEVVDAGEFDVSTGILGRNIQGYGIIAEWDDDNNMNDLFFWTYDNDWYNVEGEQIRVYYESNDTLFSSGETDEEGEFIARNLPEDNFTFTIMHDGTPYNRGECYIYPPHELLPDDSYEENDDREHAAEITHGFYDDMFGQEYDDDWYWIEVPEGDCLRVIVHFDNNEMDLDMSLWDEDENEIDYSDGMGDYEGVFVEDLSAGRYYLELYSYGNGNYTMNVTNKTFYNQKPMWYHEADDYVTCVKISTDGEYIVSGDDGEVVKLFNRDSDVPLWSFDAGSWVNDVAISAEGEFIAVGSGNYLYLFGQDSNVPLWSYDAGEYVATVDISSDGSYIVAGDTVQTIYFFQRTGNGDPEWSYSADNDIESVAISGDGSSIVAGSGDDTIYVFDKASSDPEWTYDTGDWVGIVDISTNGEYICAGTWDRVFFFERDSGDPLWTYETGDEILDLSLSADGQYIAAGGYDATVYLFDKSKSEPLWSFFALEEVGSVDISEDGNYVFVGNDEGKDEASMVFLLDRESGEPLWQYVTGEEVNEVSISGDGSYMAVGSDEDRVYLFTASTNLYSPTIRLFSPENGSIIGSSTVTLEWGASDRDHDDLSYDVYLGTSHMTMNIVSQAQEEASYTAHSLESGATYFWKVVVSDGEHELSSPTWTFTVDIERPAVIRLIPQIDAEDVFVDSIIEIEFSELMNWSSVIENMTADFDYGTFYNETIIRMYPDDDLAFGTQYTIDFSNDPADLAGNPLQDWNPIIFTTELLTVSIQSPGMDEEITQSATIVGTANPMADTVEIQIEGTWVEADSFENGYHGGARNSGEWRYELDCSQMDDGSFSFKVRCTCGPTYSNDLLWGLVIFNNEPPVINTFSVDKNDYSNGESINFSIELDDPDGIEDIVSAEIYGLDEYSSEFTLIPLDISNSILETFELPELAIGIYTFRLIVRDIQGMMAEENLTFNLVNAEPEIRSLELESPSYESGETIIFTTEIHDADGITDITLVTIEVLDGTGTVRFTAQLPLKSIISYSFKPDIEPGIYIMVLSVEDGEGAVCEENAALTITEKSNDGDDELNMTMVMIPAALGASLLMIGLMMRKRKPVQTRKPPRAAGKKARKRMCPACSEPVRFIPQYKRWYCDSCEEYVVMRKPGQGPPKKRCPQCSTEMEYVKESRDHYCWECEAYLEDMSE